MFRIVYLPYATFLCAPMTVSFILNVTSNGDNIGDLDRVLIVIDYPTVMRHVLSTRSPSS